MRMIVMLLAAVNVPCAAQAGPEYDVRCREIGFSHAAEARDAGRFEAFIDSDARFVGQAVSRGPRAIVEAWAAFLSPDGPSIAWRPQFVEVLDDGALALSRGPYRIIGKDADGREAERWGTFNSVWRLNDDGQWRVVFDAGSAPDEIPSDEQRALLAADDDCAVDDA